MWRHLKSEKHNDWFLKIESSAGGGEQKIVGCSQIVHNYSNLLEARGALPSVGDALREATQVKNIWVPYGA